MQTPITPPSAPTAAGGELELSVLMIIVVSPFVIALAVALVRRAARALHRWRRSRVRGAIRSPVVVPGAHAGQESLELLLPNSPRSERTRSAPDLPRPHRSRATSADQGEITLRWAPQE